eukprot:g975.t1
MMEFLANNVFGVANLIRLENKKKQKQNQRGKKNHRRKNKKKKEEEEGDNYKTRIIFSCGKVCGQPMLCGHPCVQKCHILGKEQVGGGGDRNLPSSSSYYENCNDPLSKQMCTSFCGARRVLCEHSCRVKCHFDKDVDFILQGLEERRKNNLFLTSNVTSYNENSSAALTTTSALSTTSALTTTSSTKSTSVNTGRNWKLSIVDYFIHLLPKPGDDTSMKLDESPEDKNCIKKDLRKEIAFELNKIRNVVKMSGAPNASANLEPSQKRQLDIYSRVMELLCPKEECSAQIQATCPCGRKTQQVQCRRGGTDDHAALSRIEFQKMYNRKNDLNKPYFPECDTLCNLLNNNHELANALGIKTGKKSMNKDETDNNPTSRWANLKSSSTTTNSTMRTSASKNRKLLHDLYDLAHRRRVQMKESAIQNTKMKSSMTIPMADEGHHDTLRLLCPFSPNLITRVQDLIAEKKIDKHWIVHNVERRIHRLASTTAGTTSRMKGNRQQRSSGKLLDNIDLPPMQSDVRAVVHEWITEGYNYTTISYGENPRRFINVSIKNKASLLEKEKEEEEEEEEEETNDTMNEQHLLYHCGEPLLLMSKAIDLLNFKTVDGSEQEEERQEVVDRWNRSIPLSQRGSSQGGSSQGWSTTQQSRDGRRQQQSWSQLSSLTTSLGTSSNASWRNQKARVPSNNLTTLNSNSASSTAVSSHNGITYLSDPTTILLFAGSDADHIEDIISELCDGIKAIERQTPNDWNNTAASKGNFTTTLTNSSRNTFSRGLGNSRTSSITGGTTKFYVKFHDPLLLQGSYERIQKIRRRGIRRLAFSVERCDESIFRQIQEERQTLEMLEKERTGSQRERKNHSTNWTKERTNKTNSFLRATSEKSIEKQKKGQRLPVKGLLSNNKNAFGGLLSSSSDEEDDDEEEEIYDDKKENNDENKDDGIEKQQETTMEDDEFIWQQPTTNSWEDLL